MFFCGEFAHLGVGVVEQPCCVLDVCQRLPPGLERHDHRAELGVFTRAVRETRRVRGDVRVGHEGREFLVALADVCKFLFERSLHGIIA